MSKLKYKNSSRILPRIIKLNGVATSPYIAHMGVYTITHDATGKQYHGSTSNLHRRISEHEGDLRTKTHSNKKLLELLDHYPEFTLTFTRTFNKEDAVKLEQDLIDGTPENLLLNASLNTSNTIAGLWDNDEYRKRLSEMKKGNQHAKGVIFSDARRKEISDRFIGNQYRLGIEHTEETRRKMSESHTGVKRSPEEIAKSAESRTKRRVKIDDKIFQNAAKAAEEIGMSYEGINRRCRSPNFPNYSFINKEDNDSVFS